MNHRDLDGLPKLVAELLVVRASGHTDDKLREYPNWELPNNQLKELLRKGVGGVILFGGTTLELKHRCETLNQWATTPLLLCADIEEGLGQRFHGGTWLVPPLALGQIFNKDAQKAIDLAERYGRCIAKQAKSCGLNWILAPVCDVNNNSDNPVINVRAWSEDPYIVAKLVNAFQKGVESEGLLACAKHFPGHGDTTVDSHLELPKIQHDMKRLENIELIPFKASISNGVPSVMTAHIQFEEIDKKYPATLSHKVINQLLRQELGFEGLIVTDALVMKSISDNYGSNEAAVMAFAAGSDLIMMPDDPLGTIKALCNAFQAGRIPIDRLHQSLRRRRKAIERISSLEENHKSSGGEFKYEPIEQDDDKKLAEELISNSLIVRNPHKLSSTNSGINLLRVDNINAIRFLSNTAPAIQLPPLAGYQNVIIHRHGVSPWRTTRDNPLDLECLGADSVILQLFIRGNPFNDTKDQQEAWSEAVQQLQKEKLLKALVVYGSPYLWEKLVPVLDPHLPAVYCPGQMPNAQELALKSLFRSNIPLNTTKGNIHKAFTD